MTTEVFKRPESPSLAAISIVIPTFNRRSMLVECLSALQHQVSQDVEIIVVDNGPSQDGTRAAVLSLAEDDPRIVYVSTTQEGDFVARNIGCHLSTGDLLLTIDDDWIMTDSASLEYLIRRFREDSQLGVLGLSPDYSEYWSQPVWRRALRRGRVLFREPGRVSRWGRVTARFFDLEPGERHRVDHVRSCCMAFRRNLGASLGFFPTLYVRNGDGFRAETELCVRIGGLGYQVELSTECVGLHVGANRSEGVVGRQMTADKVRHLARNHILFTLRNFWNRSTAPIFLACDLLIGNSSQPGLIRLLLSAKHFGKFTFVKASMGGKLQGFPATTSVDIMTSRPGANIDLVHIWIC